MKRRRIELFNAIYLGLLIAVLMSCATVPSPELTQQEYRPVLGTWVRTPGYEIIVDQVKSDGQMKVAYYNPRSGFVHVSESKAETKNEVIHLFIKLEDAYYSGMYYGLTYDAKEDILKGQYNDPYRGTSFPVAFTRQGASLPSKTKTVPLPSDLRIVQPAAGVPKELGAFSEKWTGVWDGILNHILVVEEINPPHAIAVYAYGAAVEWGIDSPGWRRIRGEFIDSTTLKLSLPQPATVIYRMQADGTLDATYEYAGGISRAKMTRMKE
jgi:hypothetical protein